MATNTVGSYTGWGKLQKVVVGELHPEDYFDVLPDSSFKERMQKLSTESIEDLKNLKQTLLAQGVEVYGLQNFFRNQKIKFIRANVGDRYVKEKMQKENFNLGGEQSGHIILGKFATTGDGLLVALEILFSMRKGKKASELFDLFKLTPQILENVKVKDKSIINSTKCKVAIKKSERIIKNYGRMLVRKSGTEPKIRIMGESNNIYLLKKCINIVKRSIK